MTKIKDLTKNLRKNSKEEHQENDSRTGNGVSRSVVAPRNSLSMFSAERKGVSNLNNRYDSVFIQDLAVLHLGQ